MFHMRNTEISSTKISILVLIIQDQIPAASMMNLNLKWEKLRIIHEINKKKESDKEHCFRLNTALEKMKSKKNSHLEEAQTFYTRKKHTRLEVQKKTLKKLF